MLCDSSQVEQEIVAKLQILLEYTIEDLLQTTATYVRDGVRARVRYKREADSSNTARLLIAVWLPCLPLLINMSV